MGYFKTQLTLLQKYRILSLLLAKHISLLSFILKEVKVLESKLCIREDLVIGYGDAYMPHGVMPCLHQPLFEM
jgi:hypothetical protein